MSETLLRCPFCGGEAKIDKTITNTVSVECTVCHASSRIILCTEGDIEQKAIKAWNTRKPMDRIVERLEEERLTSHSARSEFITGMNLVSANVCVGEINTYTKAIKIVKEEGGIE